ncbi:MAG TPA: DMT family transporter [Bacteroidales bacterium]|nr:DMT family transporter [Bacteroidales bacterium]HNS46386.1 DMT family transporter [Bacteroidales bacterium]
MKTTIVKSELLLLLAALIWGFAFTAQRVGMEYMGPFLFNGIRFGLGALVLGTFILVRRNREIDIRPEFLHDRKRMLARGGIVAGLMVFAGASLQQTGMVYTTAGNAGFITGLYVVFVPVLGLFLRQRPAVYVWIGAVMAAAGMYLLSVTGNFQMSKGDLYVLGCAFVWAFHVLYIGHLSPRVDALKLALIQYVITSVLSLLIAVFFETILWRAIQDATLPLLYGGIFSVGIAYTLQIVGQKKAPPAHAAIILSLEAVFAALGGWLILHEVLSTRALIGCALMLAGMVLAQVKRGNVAK